MTGRKDQKLIVSALTGGGPCLAAPPLALPVGVKSADIGRPISDPFRQGVDLCLGQLAGWRHVAPVVVDGANNQALVRLVEENARTHCCRP